MQILNSWLINLLIKIHKIALLYNRKVNNYCSAKKHLATLVH